MYNSYNATLKTPYLLINDHKIFRNRIYKQKNLIIKTWLKKKFFSSVSARKLKCPSSARLEPENSSSGSSLLSMFFIGGIYALSVKKLPAKSAVQNGFLTRIVLLQWSKAASSSYVRTFLSI